MSGIGGVFGNLPRGPPRNAVRLLVGILGGFLLILTVWNSWYVVDAGERAVVFNSVTGGLRETDSGFHLMVPFVDVVTRYETRSQLYSTHAEGASRDLQIVNSEIAVRYHPDSGAISSIHKNLGPDYADRAIKPAVQEAVKAATARYNAVQLIEERPLIKLAMVESLSKTLGESSIVLDELNIVDFDFSEEFNAAIELKVVAKQEAEQANNTLQRTRFEQQAKVITAQADYEAALLQANTTRVKAEADRDAARIVTDGLSEDYLNLLRIRQWNGVLPGTLVTDGSADVLVGALGTGSSSA